MSLEILSLPSFCVNYLDSIEVAEVVISHINQCRKYTPLKTAQVVIIPEANLSGHCLNLQETLRRMGHTPLFMIEDKGSVNSRERDLPGTITTRKHKIAMINLLKEKYLKRGNIGFFHAFVTANHERSKFDDIKKEVIEELRRFNRKLIPKTDDEGELYYEIIYNGKGGGNDDYVLALAIGVYWKEIFFTDKRYQLYW